jgi:SnoaL-like domain
VNDDSTEIGQLKARYFRTLDRKDWPGFRELFVPAVTFDFPGEGGFLNGIDAFLATVVPALRTAITVHHGHMPEISVRGDDEAVGIWAMEDRLRFPAPHPIVEIHGFGHYHDTFRRTPEGWRIASVRLERLTRDVTRR